MSADFEPGTVAVATVRGVPNVRVFKYSGSMWSHAWDGERCSIQDKDVTDVRPLAVLDVADLPDLRSYLPEMPRDWDDDDHRLSALADQIEAQVRPPRIPEPGLWGVVEASSSVGSSLRFQWVRDEHDKYAPWLALGTTRRNAWATLIDPVLVRDGIEGPAS